MNIFLPIITALVLVMGFTVFFGAPYVPSRQKDVIRVFTKLYKLGPSDLLIDLGSGDGKVLKIASEKFGASSIGIEMNPILVLISRFRLRKINSRSKTNNSKAKSNISPKDKRSLVLCQNFFKYSFPVDTTVVYIFGESRDIDKMFDKVSSEAKRLSKKIYIISYGFKSQRYQPIKQDGAYYLYSLE